ncbi:hypothetical protein BN1723_005489 [Verticillium longisporum]|uniref:Uncharacterized protein n=1 Tax=Verticillium longisporum TaxID=100787 RepID=A0A0G4N9C9_VERLO|nr:hypothetical protein BN1723_005489 [Verticillium longisporum]
MPIMSAFSSDLRLDRHPCPLPTNLHPCNDRYGHGLMMPSNVKTKSGVTTSLLANGVLRRPTLVISTGQPINAACRIALGVFSPSFATPPRGGSLPCRHWSASVCPVFGKAALPEGSAVRNLPGFTSPAESRETIERLHGHRED